MASVFHYTDAEGLLGILSSDSLYATDYRYLNDATEAALIRGYILPIFQAEISKITRRLVEKRILKDDYYKELGTNADVLQSENLYGSFTKAVDNVSPFFVVSFCKHPESSDEYRDGLLSQWRGYAENGGFAIEFDEDGLDALSKFEQEKFAYAGFKSADVSYLEHEKVFNPTDYEGVAGEMVWQVFHSVGKDISSETGHKNVDEAVLKFAETAPFLKHQGFYEEEEYRIVFLCLRTSKIPPEEKRPPKPIQFRKKNGLLTPFIELFRTLSKPLPIKGIVVGPHPLQEKQVESVKMLLEKKGIDASIRASQIPYRK